MAPSWRDRTRWMLSHPYTDIAVVVLVLVSVGLLVVEFALPIADPWVGRVAIAGDVITAIFIVELSGRFWVARSKARFFRRYWVDILSVMPATRPARLFRVLRVLRLFRAGVLMNRRLMWRGWGLDGVRQLVLLASLTAAMVLAGTMLLHVVEPGPLADTHHAIWYAMYVLVAGEPIGGEPTTLGGRAVTLGLMFGGLTVFGMFVGTVSAAMVARLTMDGNVHDMDYDELIGHIVVCGWNRSGATMLREVFGQADRSLHLVLVTEGPRPEDLPLDALDPGRFFHHQGDWTRVDVLQHVNVQDAAKAILLTDETIPRSDQDRDARTVLAALTIEKMAPDIYTIAEVTSKDAGAHLEHANIEEVVIGDWYAGVILGSTVRNPGLVGVLDEVLSHAYGNAFHTVPVPDSWVGRSVKQARTELHDAHEVTLVSVHANGDRVVNPAGDRPLAQGETLVVLGQKRPRLG